MVYPPFVFPAATNRGRQDRRDGSPRQTFDAKIRAKKRVDHPMNANETQV